MKTKRKCRSDVCKHCRKKLEIMYSDCPHCGGDEYYECPKCGRMYDMDTGDEL